MVLVRHGETTANLNLTLQGQTDGQLTKVGIRQAELLAQHSKIFQANHIFSSDLTRAQHTAKIIAERLTLPVQLSKILREWNIGELDGHPAQSLEAAISASKDSIADFTPPGGESLNDLRGRAENFLNSVRQKHQGQVLIVCSHGDFIRMLLSVVLIQEIKQAIKQPLDNTSYTIVEHLESKTWQIKEINKTPHLITLSRK
ncbi:MAG: histidine phosphatase family protein [Chloroflexota bacterium]